MSRLKSCSQSAQSGEVWGSSEQDPEINNRWLQQQHMCLSCYIRAAAKWLMTTTETGSVFDDYLTLWNYQDMHPIIYCLKQRRKCVSCVSFCFCNQNDKCRYIPDIKTIRICSRCAADMRSRAPSVPDYHIWLVLTIILTSAAWIQTLNLPENGVTTITWFRLSWRSCGSTFASLTWRFDGKSSTIIHITATTQDGVLKMDEQTHRLASKASEVTWRGCPIRFQGRPAPSL